MSRAARDALYQLARHVAWSALLFGWLISGSARAQAPAASTDSAAPAVASEALEHENAATLLALAEEAMTTIDYPRSCELALRAIATGHLDIEDLTRAYRIVAITAAQINDAPRAEQAFLRLFALEPESAIATRLAPERRSPVLNARGFWSVHKDAFKLDVSFARRERQLVVHVADPLDWGRTVHVWSRFGDRPYVRVQRRLEPEVLIDLEDVEPVDTLEVYAFVVDDRDNTILRFGREHDPKVFELSEEELQALLRRDIRGGQVGSFARRLEELDVQVGVHGYMSLEFKPNGDVPTFDLHHATAMIRANFQRSVALELAFEWEHLGLDSDDFYLPHAFVDIKFADFAVVRGGFFEVPVGAFNEYLYPDFLRITGLPPLFSVSVVPALWSEVGLQLRGRLDLSSLVTATYAAFVGNGLEQHDEDPKDGMLQEGGDIREMRFHARDAVRGNKAVGGRVGLEIGEFDVGLSGYTGRYTLEAARQLSMADVDLSFRGKWLTLRAEGALALQELSRDRLLRKYGMYTLIAARPIPHLEPYAQYDYADTGSWTQRALVGLALYPFPRERSTSNLRLKSEAGYEFPQSGGKHFVWFMQLTTGF